MGNPNESVKLRQGIEIQVDNKKVDHLRSITGGGIVIPQVDTTSSKSKQQTFSTGRASYEPIRFTFANAKTNTPIIKTAVEYFKNPQTKPRSTIAVIEITRDGAAQGQTITYYDCFCTKLRLPTGNAQEGVLTTEMEWYAHRSEHGKGGVS